MKKRKKIVLDKKFSPRNHLSSSNLYIYIFNVLEKTCKRENMQIRNNNKSYTLHYKIK